MSGSSKRSQYYALAADSLAKELGLTKAERARVGETKLGFISSKTGTGVGDLIVNSKKHLFDLVEGRSVAALAAYLGGRRQGNVKHSIFLLNDAQRARLDRLLIKYGAVKTPQGLTGREDALMKIVAKLS